VKSGDNIMDFGCGTADLYGYLKDRDIIVDYTGIDIMSDFIKTAKDRYDEKITILDTNVLYYMEKFDWYFASGVFSVGFDIESITEHIKHFVHSSNKGVCFNLLNKETFSGDVQVSFLPLEVKSMYVDLFPKHDVEVVSDYSDDDFTIIIRQK
jgi:SAM-dependent methyltransferase